MNQRSHALADILLIEDNPADVEITRQGLAAAGVPHNLHVVSDGEQAVMFLRREGMFVDSPQPDVVLLDLNLPGKGGRLVLQDIKSDEQLRHIPVIVLSSSNAPADINDAYQLHANSYVIKPIEFEPFVQMVQGICDYWLKMVARPSVIDKLA